MSPKLGNNVVELFSRIKILSDYKSKLLSRFSIKRFETSENIFTGIQILVVYRDYSNTFDITIHQIP